MEWNRRNIILAVVLLVLGFGSGGVIYVHQEGGLGFVMFRLEKWVEGVNGTGTEMTTEEERLAKRETDRIRKALLVKYPSLRLEGKDVATERNGYLALFELAKNPDLRSLMDSEILVQVNEKIIDPALVRKELSAHDAIGKEIERIAALPERSNIIDGKIHNELIPAAVVKNMGDYLVLQARLAALDGDEVESFRYLSLAVNLTEHVGDIEAPYLLSETVHILIKQNIRSEFFKSILPTLDKSMDLEKWRSKLEPQINYPQRQSLLLKGEWNMASVDNMYLIFDMVPDPEETIIAWAKYTDANAKINNTMNFQQISVSTPLDHKNFTKNLSREGDGLFEILHIGAEWMLGSLRSVVVEHHYAAALDLLIREQKGEDISKLTETFLLNPQTGKPFAYDAATRTLEKVTGVYEVDALKLPW